MKRFILSIIMAMLLIVMVPAMAMATPVTTDSISKNSLKTITAEMSAIGAGRTIDSLVWSSTGVGTMKGTAYYMGGIQTATKEGLDWNIYYPITAIEKFEYIIDTSLNITEGKVAGTLIINSSFKDYINNDFSIITDKKDYALVSFSSNVWGNIQQVEDSNNIYIGLAGDIGSWCTDKAKGTLKDLEKGQGDWTATVKYISAYQTFVGSATIDGAVRK
jgi:hypothetical protein